MRTWDKGLLVLCCLGMGSAEATEVEWGGQLRPRYEYRSPAGGLGDDTFTSMRARAQMTARVDSGLTAFIQVQDVRLWGEEANTLGDFSADSFDLHQGYIQVDGVAGDQSTLKIGRQAVAFGGQRLVGAVEWTQQGRVFDGLRLGLAPSWGKVDVLAIQLAEATSARHAANAYLTGAYATLTGLPGALDLYGLYNKVSGAGDTDQLTLGARWAAQQERFKYRLEGSYQTGTRGGADVAAFMFGGRVGTKVGKVGLTLWYDYLSGDDDPTDGETKVFDTLFATNHKFYGFADLFLNIPVHTGGLGLQDIALKAALPLAPKLNLGAHLHAFSTAEKGGLKSQRLGEEIDLTLTYKYRPKLALVGGFSHVFAAKSLGLIGRLGEDMDFAYLMTNLSF